MNKVIKPVLITLSIITILSIALCGLGDALIPLAISFALAYLSFPLILKAEKKNIQRHYAVITVFGISSILFITLGLLIIPGLVSETKDFVQELPINIHKAIVKVESIAIQNGYDFNINKESIKLFLTGQKENLSIDIIKKISVGFKGLFTNTIRTFLTFLNLFLIPLFFFYIIDEFETISKEIKSFIPKTLRPKINKYLTLSNTVLSGYIRGQLMVALILAVLYATGLSLIGLRFGPVIGLITGLISIIPYAGFTLGFTASLMVALANFTDYSLIGGIVVVFIIIQLIEGFIITPKLVGDKVGLSAFATMLALIIGGNLLGLSGMLLAIPLAAILKAILKELKCEFQKIEFT